MYQFFLLFIILFCVGGAGYITVSHGSVGKIYNSANSEKDQYDVLLSEGGNNLATADDLEQKEKQESGFTKVFKQIIGANDDPQVSSLLAKTLSGTYSCTQIKKTLNCSSSYTFVFKPSSAAVLRIMDKDGNATATQVGTWAFDDNGQIVVSLFADGQKRFEEDRIFTLTRAAKGSELITVDYPRDYYPDILTGVFKFIKK